MKRFSSGGCYADNTPKERAIANGQRSFVSFLLLHAFHRILAVPKKAIIIIIIIIIIIVITIIIIIIIVIITLTNHERPLYSKWPRSTEHETFIMPYYTGKRVMTYINVTFAPW